jgi:uncharacterized protein with LGFP repeats
MAVALREPAGFARPKRRLQGVLVAAPPAAAATPSPSTILQSFDAGDIIADAVMFNPNTMSQAQVQSFLNGKVPTCQAVQYQTGLPCLKDYTQTTFSRPADPMCKSYTGASNESAAAIIVKVGKACNINPQVLLVVLQKEQGLVTDTWPTASQYRKATGYGCPDSSNVTCDATYNGFYNQVYKAAWALQRYTMPKGTGPGTEYYSVYSRYPVGQPGSIAYQDYYTNPNCGSKLVTVKNKATHSLYYYTPYTPNAAALAAGYGTGDSCSAYGNRNFFLYFTQWFGSTHLIVTGAINTYWSAHGGASGVLGAPTANAVTSTSNGGGTYQTFQHGTVYSSTAGTFSVMGSLLSGYTARKGPNGPLGWPTKAAASRTLAGLTGTVQSFQNGDLDTSSAGTGAVMTSLSRAYSSTGGRLDALGWPRGDAVTSSANGGGTIQVFTGGRLYAPTGKPVIAVTGLVLSRYLSRNEVAGAFGWPLTEAEAVTAHGTTKVMQSFQYGSYTVTGSSVVAIDGAIYPVYLAAGGPSGSLGWVSGWAAQSSANGGGWTQSFAGGIVYYSSVSRKAFPVTGGLLNRYKARNAAAGDFGWPTSAPKWVTAHGASKVVQSFEHGSYTVTGSSVVAISSSFYPVYLAAGGPTGDLGWVKGWAARSSASGGGWSQAFGGGTIYYSSVSGKAFPVTGMQLDHYRLRKEAAGDFGWPVSGATTITADGDTKVVQSFEHGLFTVTGSNVVAVSGAFYPVYVAAGGPTGDLGWVSGWAARTSASGGGWSQAFGGGTIFYSSVSKKAFPVTGAALTRYESRNGPSGDFGWPVSDAVPVTAHGTTKVFQSFEHGSYTVTGASAVAVSGSFYPVYVAAGGPTGTLGWVSGWAARTSASGGGWSQAFDGGTIYYSSVSRKAYPVSGDLLAYYVSDHEAAGPLGWPTGVETTQTVSGSAVESQTFQHGTLTSTNGVVTEH